MTGCDETLPTRPLPDHHAPMGGSYGGEMKIRPALDSDIEGIVNIYNHYFVHSTAIFDEISSRVEDRFGWFKTFDVAGPHRLLVAEDQDEILGYACSNPYRRDRSFSQTAEFSISMSSESRGRGRDETLYLSY
jgi:phosphinothricin acetyltransferase